MTLEKPASSASLARLGANSATRLAISTESVPHLRGPLGQHGRPGPVGRDVSEKLGGIRALSEDPPRPVPGHRERGPAAGRWPNLAAGAPSAPMPVRSSEVYALLAKTRHAPFPVIASAARPPAATPVARNASRTRASTATSRSDARR